MRPSWDAYFAELARVVATRSSCLRAQVGCVLISPARTVLATGYGGAMAGAPHCNEVGCLMIDGGCKRTVHAEVNAICQAARNGTPLVGATAFVTLSPCRACAMALVNCGVKRIVYATEYRIVDHLAEIRALGVSVEHVTGDASAAPATSRP